MTDQSMSFRIAMLPVAMPMSESSDNRASALPPREIEGFRQPTVTSLFSSGTIF
jgi:hypothetical protein